MQINSPCVASILLEPEREGLKGQEHLLDPLSDFGVDQVPVAVKLRWLLKRLDA